MSRQLRKPYLANPNRVDPDDDRIIHLTKIACDGKMRKTVYVDRNGVEFYSCCVYPYKNWNGDNGCVDCMFDPEKIDELPVKAQERIEYFKKTGEILNNPYTFEETEKIMQERKESLEKTKITVNITSK